MRIIIDGVFNHIGINSWPFEDVRRRQQDSPYKDWFVIRSWDNPQTGERFSYDGWAMVPELPEWREDENGIVAGPRDYIFAATRRWMDPDGDGDPGDGIDGWRLDPVPRSDPPAQQHTSPAARRNGGESLPSGGDALSVEVAAQWGRILLAAQDAS